MKLENLPAPLREGGLFCCWRYEDREGQRTKVPYDPRTGRRARSDDPETFAPLAVALEALERGHYSGLGVGVFGTLGAVDVDHCVDEAGELSPLARRVLDRLDAYAEYSPSGRGLRVLFTLPPDFAYDKARYYINNRKLGLEVYVAGATRRFVTVTGESLTPGRGLEERGAALLELLEAHMVRPEAATTPAIPEPERERKEPSKKWTGGPLTAEDKRLLAQIRASAQGRKFSALLAGEQLDYPSPSEGDLALCNILAFWTSGDGERMDRIFRSSGRMRDKWDRPTGGSTYGAMTLEKAINSNRWRCRPALDREEGEDLRPLRPRDYSDAGNAAVFCREYRDKLVYVSALGWLYWDGRSWVRDDDGGLFLALEFSDRMLRQAREDSQDDGGGKENPYLAHARKLRSVTRVKAMLEAARPALKLPADRLDADPFALNTPAGIVDLRTGALGPHDGRAFCTRITAVGPGEEGKELWGAFLDQITCGDGDLAGFLQQVAGMALLGKVYHEGIVLAYGGGRNGKSTFFNALLRVLGDYGGSLDIRALTSDPGHRGAALATLRGRRLVVAGELEEGSRLSAATLKQVASTDAMVIEEKYKAPETVRPSHTLALFTNHLPRVGSLDGGTWRRLLVVPFRAVIPQAGEVSDYADYLARRAGGAILAWAVEGAGLFFRSGLRLTVPETVERATGEYRQRENWLDNFLSERTAPDPAARCPARPLYLEYKYWAADVGDYVRRESEFSAAMEGAGYRKVKVRGRPVYMGLGMVTGWENPFREARRSG